ncbi:hypothetical protein KAU11_05550 [Candidatus Babeliales bacterium]|nr:hypothetical protein [Candidatus Babeliales bacterium]
MNKTIKTLFSTLLVLTTSVFADEVAKFTQKELTQVYRQCSLSNTNSVTRRKTAEKFIAKAEKTTFECEKLSIVEGKKGYKKRSVELKTQAKALKLMCEDTKRNEKLETGRCTNIEKHFAQHNNVIDFMQLGIISSTLRGIGSAASGTGSFLAHNKRAAIETLAIAAALGLGYAAKATNFGSKLFETAE